MLPATWKPKYEISIANRQYPEPDENTVTPFFTEMVGTLAEGLSLKTTEGMYAAFGERVKRFNETFDQTKKFITSIIKSNMTGNDKQAIDQKALPFDQHMKRLVFSAPPGLTAEVAIRPPEQQLAILNDSISLNVGALTYFLTRSLDELVRVHQVGLIEWFSDKVARFHFYLNSFESSATILNRQHSQNGRTHTETWEKETTKTERQQRHQHDLVDAKDLPLQTYVPYRVEKLVREIPSLFKDFFRVVKGNQIFEHVVEDVQTTVERHGESQTWTEPEPQPPRSVWQYDPALVIGNYVVAGWGEEEESMSRQVEEKTQHYWLCMPAPHHQRECRDKLMTERLNIHW